MALSIINEPSVGWFECGYKIYTREENETRRPVLAAGSFALKPKLQSGRVLGRRAPKATMKTRAPMARAPDSAADPRQLLVPFEPWAINSKSAADPLPKRFQSECAPNLSMARYCQQYLPG